MSKFAWQISQILSHK